VITETNLNGNRGQRTFVDKLRSSGTKEESHELLSNYLDGGRGYRESLFGKSDYNRSDRELCLGKRSRNYPRGTRQEEGRGLVPFSRQGLASRDGRIWGDNTERDPGGGDDGETRNMETRGSETG